MRTLIFIISSILITNYSYSQNINEISVLEKGHYDLDPSNSGFGFVSISEGENEPGNANKQNSLSIPKLNKNDRFVFTIYLDFHNNGKSDILKSSAKIEFAILNDEKLSIKGIFNGKNISPQTDLAYLYDFKDSYSIKFLSGSIENNHSTTDSTECEGYNISKVLSKSDIFNKGVNLGILDTRYKGWCDQGYVIATFEINN